MAKRKTPYHHGDLRRALLDAATDLLVAEGPAAVTLRATARVAGVSHAAPYRHFADKSALLASLAEHGFRQLEADLSSARDAARDPPAQIRATGQAYIAFAVRHPEQYELMFGAPVSAASNPSLTESANAAFAVLHDVVARGHADGLLSSSPPDRLASFAWSAVHGFASLVISGRFPGDPGAIEALGDEVIRGVLFGLLERG